jgi:hypothetical protein
MRRALTALAAAAAIGLTAASCGGKAAPLPIEDEPIPPHPPCASADGIRICGGGAACPPLPYPECAGEGCTAAHDLATGDPAEGGACWADASDKGIFRCGECNDGDACIQRRSDQLVCVSVHVCEALWDVGIQDVCRYGDLSLYDHRPLPAAPAACPAERAAEGVLCGGGCGPCKLGRCVGRSPGRPFGVCRQRNRDPSSAGLDRPGAYYGCSKDASGTCPDYLYGSPEEGRPAVCAVFDLPDEGDETLAENAGICMKADACRAVSQILPMHCFDVPP